MHITEAGQRSLIAVIGWSLGLTLAGAAICLAGVGFLFNFRNMTSNYFEATITSGRSIPVLAGRYDKMRFDHFKSIGGSVLIFLGVIFLAVGIYGLVSI